MEIITRHIINPASKFYYYDSNLRQTICMEYSEFCAMIDYWKVMLVDGFDAARGQTVLIDLNQLSSYYYSAIFAVAELGMILIVDMPHAHNEDDITGYKINMHGQIDIVITARKQFEGGKNLFDWKKHQHIGRKIVFEEDFQTYKIKDNSLYNRVSKTIFCQPDDDLIWSHTSGTTDVPKRAPDFHRKIYHSSKRIAKYLNLKSEQKVMHITGLHHGSDLTLHLLPTLMRCEHHHVISEAHDSDRQVQLVEQEKINHLYFYTSRQVTNFLEKINPISHCLDIFKLFIISPSDLQMMKKKNINSMTTFYGDMVSGHAIFVKRVPYQTEIETYDPLDFGEPPDDYYQYKLIDDRLWTRSLVAGTDWATGNDIFECYNGRWKFCGRGDSYRINQEWIKLSDLEYATRSLFGDSGATVVIDIDFEKIYLAIWQPNLEAEEKFYEFLSNNYKNVCVSVTLRDQIYDHYFVGRKPDNQKLREYCRKILLNQTSIPHT